MEQAPGGAAHWSRRRGGTGAKAVRRTGAEAARRTGAEAALDGGAAARRTGADSRGGAQDGREAAANPKTVRLKLCTRLRAGSSGQRPSKTPASVAELDAMATPRRAVATPYAAKARRRRRLATRVAWTPRRRLGDAIRTLTSGF
jgi:hypothetical protein